MKKKYNVGGAVGKGLEKAAGGIDPTASLASLFNLATGSIAHLLDVTNDKSDYYTRVLRKNTNPYGYAMGGVAINAEGGEMMETPNGKHGMIEGEDHEEGGVDMEVPEGTTIYSKRIGIDGDTMAERKEKRMNNVKKALKGYFTDPFDVINKNTLQRPLENNAKEEATDVMLMNASRMQEEYGKGGTVSKAKAKKILHDGTVHGKKLTDKQRRFFAANAYANGGTVPKWFDYKEFYNYLGEDGLKKYLPKFGADNKWGPEHEQAVIRSGFDKSKGFTFGEQGFTPITGVAPQSSESVRTVQGIAATPDINMNTPATPSDKEPLFYDDKTYGGVKKGLNNFDFGKKLGENTTDVNIGETAEIAGAVAPTLLTLLNRAGDRPNRNYFSEYGTEALNANADAMRGVRDSQDTALSALETQRAGLRRDNQLGARSVNTRRALDLATFGKAQEAERQIRTDYNTTLRGLFSERAGLLNQADSQRMAGAERAGIADIQDRDNFYTQLSTSISGAANSMMHFEKMRQLKKNIESGKVESFINEMTKLFG